ncbi:MAG: lysylphosphatidylglycerol synthase transmembrane domain-containing protein [Mariprofundaceae bacterium]|nr:lysylphosphatidylglycerol synthase transmembrane domain-containing protein [Mariprofundaceae bacterium]
MKTAQRGMLLLKILLTFSLLYMVFRYVDVGTVWQRMMAVNPWYLIASWLCIIVGYFLCGLRWAWMAEGLGIKISRRRKIRLYFLGMFTSLFLPSTIGGDVVRAVLLAKGEGRQGIGLPAAASVILDRLNGMYALILLLSISMFFFSWPRAWWMSWMFLVVSMWLVLLLYPWMHARLPRWFEKIKQLPLDTKTFQSMWWKSLPVSFVFQAMVVQAHVFLAMGVGLEMNWAAISIMVGLVALVATLPISLNGFGIREAGYVGFAVYFGASSESATAMAALWIIVLSLAALPGAFILWRLGGLNALKS